MVCSCTMSSNFVWLQIIFFSCINEPRFSPSCSHSCVKMADHFASQRYTLKKKQTWWSNDKIIIVLGYRNVFWFVSVSQINYLPQPSAFWQIIDLLATDKSQYFAQPCPIIVKYHYSLLIPAIYLPFGLVLHLKAMAESYWLPLGDWCFPELRETEHYGFYVIK